MSGKKQLSTQIENGGEAVFESRSGRLFVGKLSPPPSSSATLSVTRLVSIRTFTGYLFTDHHPLWCSGGSVQQVFIMLSSL